MIRFIFSALFVVLFLILSMPLMLFTWLFHKCNPKAADRFGQAVVMWAFRVVLFISGTKLTILGLENVPKDEPVLYVGNHRSFFDILITYTRCPGVTGYVAKKELGKVPLLNIWMKLLHCQFLDRENIKAGLKTILTCIELEKQGISIAIFPEGTRNKEEGTLLPFHDGSFKIAQKSGCLVVPFALEGTSAIFEDHFPRIKKQHIILRYGTPVRIADLPKENQREVGKYFSEQILGMIQENKALKEELLTSKKG